MNKSLEYVVQKTKGKERETMKVLPLTVFGNIEPLKQFILREVRNTGEPFADFVYDPEADFDYYESIVGEDNGNVLENMKELFKKINDLESFYPPAVEDIDTEKVLDYVIHYIAGDIILREWVDEGTKKFEMALPIKYEVEDRKQC